MSRLSILVAVIAVAVWGCGPTNEEFESLNEDVHSQATAIAVLSVKPATPTPEPTSTPLPTVTPQPTASPQPTPTPDLRIETMKSDIRIMDDVYTERLRSLSESMSDLEDTIESLDDDVIRQNTVNQFCELRFRIFAVAHAALFAVDGDDDWAEWWAWHESQQTRFEDYSYAEVFPLCSKEDGEWQLPASPSQWQ